MHSSKIEILKIEYDELMAFCRANGQVSFELYINNTYKKSLLLSVASYFEAKIIGIIHNYVHVLSKSDKKLIALIDNKVLNRQYHTLFDWDKNNTNKFWSLFGVEAKILVRDKIKNSDLAEAELAFIIIGRERNNLVHRNYIEVNVNYTFEEIYAKYTIACKFVDFIQDTLSKRK